MLLTFRTELTWWGSNTLPLREVTMTRPYLPGVCKSEYSVCLDRFTGNKLSTKFPSIFARLCLGANRYSTFSSMRYLLKLAPSRMEISTGAEAKNTGWLATKWPSLWNDVLSPSCNTCRNILECSNSARAMNQHQHQRYGASVFNPRSWITEMMKRCVEYHQVLLGQRHHVRTTALLVLRLLHKENSEWKCIETLQRRVQRFFFFLHVCELIRLSKGTTFLSVFCQLILGRSRLRFVSRNPNCLSAVG